MNFASDSSRELSPKMALCLAAITIAEIDREFKKEKL